MRSFKPYYMQRYVIKLKVESGKVKKLGLDKTVKPEKLVGELRKVGELRCHSLHSILSALSSPSSYFFYHANKG